MIACIDTALENCSVSLSWKGEMIDSIVNPESRKASEVLHVQIRELCDKNNVGLHDLKAIAINGGPGSYTGLRIAAAAAKGFCYALNIPFIHIDGFSLMVNGIVNRLKIDQFDYYIPMIDARRDEVYTATLNAGLEFIIDSGPMIIDTGSFKAFRNKNTLFFGNGAEKSRQLMGFAALNEQEDPSFISDFKTEMTDFNELAWSKWLNKDFGNIYLYKPDYLKNFYFKK